jgi:hypothetical protein
LYQAEIDYICERLQSVTPTLAPELQIVHASVPGFDATLYFGIVGNQVFLLNRTLNQALAPGLDLETWNRLADNLGIGAKLEWEGFVSYACLLHSLNRRQFPSYMCPGESDFRLNRMASGEIEVTLVVLRGHIVFAPGGHVEVVEVR